MTSEELQAIRERCEKATLGPWEIGGLWNIYSSVESGTKRPLFREPRKYEDAEFTAHARTDLPKALDEIERLRNVFGMIQKLCRDEEIQMDMRVMLAYEHARQVMAGDSHDR